jgi:integrase
VTSPSPEAGAAISNWRPRLFDDDVAVFSRRVVASVGPKSKQRAKALLFAAAKIGEFATSLGVGLEMDTVLTRAFIERFVLEAPMSAPTRRTLKSNLGHLASHVPGHEPAPARCPREHAKAPYTDGEISLFLALADAQPTPARRHKASALICLCAGAGLVPGELRGLRGTDVVSRSGGVLVLVKAKRPRAVPVLLAFQERLLQAAGFAGGDYLVGGSDPERRNVTNNLVSSLSGGTDLGRLELSRLRSSFLVAMAAQIGLRAFMDAAGISCSQRLGDLVAKMASPTEEQAVALLCPRDPR